MGQMDQQIWVGHVGDGQYPLTMIKLTKFQENIHNYIIVIILLCMTV